MSGPDVAAVDQAGPVLERVAQREVAGVPPGPDRRHYVRRQEAHRAQPARPLGAVPGLVQQQPRSPGDPLVVQPEQHDVPDRDRRRPRRREPGPVPAGQQQAVRPAADPGPAGEGAAAAPVASTGSRC